jgi:hypothetical protein
VRPGAGRVASRADPVELEEEAVVLDGDGGAHRTLRDGGALERLADGSVRELLRLLETCSMSSANLSSSRARRRALPPDRQRPPKETR